LRLPLLEHVLFNLGALTRFGARQPEGEIVSVGYAHQDAHLRRLGFGARHCERKQNGKNKTSALQLSHFFTSGVFL
jgi:hypothetical protein